MIAVIFFIIHVLLVIEYCTPLHVKPCPIHSYTVKPFATSLLRPENNFIHLRYTLKTWPSLSLHPATMYYTSVTHWKDIFNSFYTLKTYFTHLLYPENMPYTPITSSKHVLHLRYTEKHVLHPITPTKKLYIPVTSCKHVLHSKEHLMEMVLSCAACLLTKCFMEKTL